jgi:D-sedoheptulose 7-phosphate isomerase
MGNYQQDIQNYFNREIDVIRRLDLRAINWSINGIMEALDRDADIYIFGNGGSASIASHYVNDFNKGVSEKIGKKFRMHCLSDNISLVMAIANDIGYDEVFRFQLEGVLRPDDLVIGISGSGNSLNVLNAIEYANTVGAKTMGITGYTGGRLKHFTRYHMDANVDDMQISEDIFMIFDHMMMKVLGDRA